MTILTELSDERYKQQISEIQDLETLLTLAPKQYLLNGGNKLQFGFVAQDLEKTGYANLVYENNAKIKSIAYTQLIPILVAHIQKQDERIRALEAKSNSRNL